MTRTRLIAFALLLLLVGGAWWAMRHGARFDVHAFWQQLHHVDFRLIAVGILLIYTTFFFRAFRWAVFMRAHQRVAALSLVGPQFVGFTAVALFGRIADLSRPYLLAQKTRTPLPLQVAVYTIERMFDLGAAAIVFSSALAFTPHDMPHHEVFVRVGIGSLAGTLLLAAFATAMRVAGVATAALVRRMLSRVSNSFGAAVEDKLLGFRLGLNAISSFSDFAITATLSLVMWFLIAMAYKETANAFLDTPSLATLTISRTMLLMAASIGGSLLQLPVLGWFTQIATTAAAMHGFYGTPLEPATACGALLLVVTFLCIIPTGLVFARLDRVSLGDLTRTESNTPHASSEVSS